MIMKKIKVAHIIDGMGLGGVTTTTYHNLRCLPLDKYEILVCGLNQHSDNRDARDRIAEQYRELGIEPVLLDEKKKKFHVIGDICRWLLQHKVDILHTHSYKPNLYGRLAGILCKKQELKIVAHYHNAYDDKWQRDDSLIYDQLLEPWTDHFIACSPWVRRYVSERANLPIEKITTILNGVDAERYVVTQDPVSIKSELGIPRERTAIGIVGRISEQKGQDNFLRAAQIIQQTIPETVFLIIGTGDEKNIRSLNNLAREVGIEQSVHFLGHSFEMPKIYRALDLLIVPSRWEGFGKILVEGMAAGKPIVATNVGPIPDVVVAGETARLVPPSSPEALAKEAIFLLTHLDCAKKMGRKGIDRAKEFSWEQAGAQLDQLYTRAISKVRD